MYHSIRYHKLFYRVTGDFEYDGKVIHLVNHSVRIPLIQAERPQEPDFSEFVYYENSEHAYLIRTVNLESIH